MSEFFKSFGQAFSSPQQSRQQQQPPHHGSASNHGSYGQQQQQNNGYPGNASQQHQPQHSQSHGPSHPSPFDRSHHSARPNGSPPPQPASYSYSPAPSPMRPAAPHSSSYSAATPSAAAAHAAEPSLDHLRSEHARVEHSVSVCEMRLKHCLDSEDERSSGEAARVLAMEKKQFRELSAQLALREKREGAEQRVRGIINSKFESERSLIAERRRQIETAKQRLRNAFALPAGAHSAAGAGHAASPSHSPPLLGTHISPEMPLQSDRASHYQGAGRSPSPLPPAHTAHTAAAASRGSSPYPSPPASPLPDCSLFDLLPRLRMDVGKAQVALEHQNLRVDSIELSSCVAQAHAAAVSAAASSVAAGGPGGPGGPSVPSPSASPDPLPPSSELSSFFKSSRKEVVRHLLDTLAEVDGLTQHIKQAEAFMAYLQMQPAAAGGQEQQHQAAAGSASSGDAMQH